MNITTHLSEFLFNKQRENFSISSDQNNLRKKTRLVCTITTGTTLEHMIEFIKKGCNIFRIHVAYQDRQFLKKASKMRDEIEKKYNMIIPLLIDLKGNVIRLGKFEEHSVNLQKGQEFRLFSKKHNIKGNKSCCFCDLGEWFENMKVGDKLLTGFGNNVLQIKNKETLAEGMAAVNMESRFDLESIMSKSECQTTTSFSVRSQNLRGDMYKAATFSNMSREISTTTMGDQNYEIKKINDDMSETTDKSEVKKKVRLTAQQRKKMFEMQYENDAERTIVTPHVLVLEVLSDCKLTSFQPVFFDLEEEDTRIIPKSNKMTSTVSRKDIMFIDKAQKYNFDFIAVNDVTSADCLNEVHELCAKRPNVRVIAKIQSPAAFKNIVEIIEACDGLLISRNYLANFIPNKYNYYIQTNMIQECKRRGKPVFILGHIFESMVNTSVPNCSEINDVVGLINDGIDGLVINNESMFSMHSHTCVGILNDVIIGAEQSQNGKGFGFHGNRGGLMQEKSEQRCLPAGWDVRANKENDNEFIRIALAGSIYTAHKMTKSTLIICLTQTGATVTYQNPYDFDCPIQAICNEVGIARKCILNRGVISLEVGSLIGTEIVIEKAISFAKREKQIQVGDYIIAVVGSVENLSGSTNCMRILKV